LYTSDALLALLQGAPELPPNWTTAT
jgi:hypothetical protein